MARDLSRWKTAERVSVGECIISTNGIQLVDEIDERKRCGAFFFGKSNAPANSGRFIRGSLVTSDLQNTMC
jgi:hypothetical protein